MKPFCHFPHRAALQRGVTLVELMVGMLIGLVAVIIITQTLLVSENQKRSTTSGSDAQVNGALSLYTIQRDVEMAGYGLTSSPEVIGCPISARFNNAIPVGFPATLSPIFITPQGARPPGSIGDSIRVLASSKTSYSVPTRVNPPVYAVGGQAFNVTSTLGMRQNDLALVASDATQPCWVFQINGVPTATVLPRTDYDAGWNLTGMPNIGYGDGSVLINLGSLIDIRYEINANTLQSSTFDIANPGTRITRDLQPDIVNLKAFYGRDTLSALPALQAGQGVVDTYDTTTPTTNEGWLRVLSVRLIVVARSGQYEKEDVTPANVSWSVGATPAVTGSASCAAGQCLTINVDHLSDYKRYRYKVFDTVIPLRNMVWRS